MNKAVWKSLIKKGDGSRLRSDIAGLYQKPGIRKNNLEPKKILQQKE